MPELLHPGRAPSLRSRLLLTISVATLLLWALTGILSYLQARHEAEEFLDGHLAVSARMLLALVSHNEDQHEDLKQRLASVHSRPQGIYEPPLEYQIARADGVVFMRSANAPDLPVLGVEGHIDFNRDGQAWRLFNLDSPDDQYRVQVAQSVELRDLAALEVAMQATLPVGMLLPLLLFLLYLSIRRGLKPLDVLAREVSSRTPDNLSPLVQGDIPREALPLVAAVNRLMFRLERTLDNERRFTADAAHELRTPLAAIKTQAQVADLSPEPADRTHAHAQLQAAVDRASRLIDELLGLARLDPLSRLEKPRPVYLAQLARQLYDDLLPLAGRLGQTLTLEADAALEVEGDPDLLAVALRNLVDNALRYTPAGGEVRIRLAREAGKPVLTVQDTGPGVPPQELDRLTERFFRGRDVATEGCGLGLALVKRICELHGVELEFRNLPGSSGLLASLRWQVGYV
jgi:two-component system, OmpR family, sensor histidine kinase QseC